MPPGEWWPKKKGGLCPPSRKKGGSGVPSFLFWEELTTWGISLSLPLRREGAEGFGQDVENGKSYFPPYFAFPTHMQRDFFFSGKKKRERSMSQLSPPFLPRMDDDGNVPEEKQRESGIDIFLLHLSKAEKSHLSSQRPRVRQFCVDIAHSSIWRNIDA